MLRVGSPKSRLRTRMRLPLRAPQLTDTFADSRGGRVEREIQTKPDQAIRGTAGRGSREAGAAVPPLADLQQSAGNRAVSGMVATMLVPRFLRPIRMNLGCSVIV